MDSTDVAQYFVSPFIAGLSQYIRASFMAPAVTESGATLSFSIATESFEEENGIS